MTIQIAIQQSSSIGVKSAVLQMKTTNFPNNRWIDINNVYLVDVLKRIEHDVKNNLPPTSTDLAHYVAASVFLHCFDGWSFLSQSIDCLIDGDVASAVHLAYYAELRAAMGFLASDGIGIFNQNHCWIDASGNATYFRGSGTHKIVWDAIEKWADIPNNSTKFLSLFSHSGKTFSEWLSAAGLPPGTPPSTQLAKDWLKTWSVDLRILGEDHNLRNEASYRPQRLEFQRQSSTHKVLYKIIEYWNACEPSSSERFEMLDRHLLRNTLEASYRIRTGKMAQGVAFKAFLDRAISNLGISPSDVLYNFLLRRTSPRGHVLLHDAKKKGKSARGVLRPFPVIARSLMLLRLASAAANEILVSNNVKQSEVAFWWRDLGKTIGLWEDGMEPSDMTDLWADVLPVIEEVSLWCDNSSNLATTINARQNLAYNLWQLKQFQRVGLWAMGL